MTPESRQRFAVLVEKRLASVLTDAETAELSSALEASSEARELYLRAVEFHLDLGSAVGKEEVRTRAPRLSLPAVVSMAAGLLFAVAGFWYLNLEHAGPADKSIRIAREPGLPGVSSTGGSARTAPKSLSTPPDLPPPPPPPPAATTPVTEMGSVPAELVLDIEGRFAALPAGYRSLLIEKDRARFEELMKTRKGTSDDLEWLKSRILGEAIPGFQRDAEMIRAKVLELERKVTEYVATDVLTLKDGRKLEGQIVQDTPETVKVRFRFGAVTIQKEDILKIEKGKGAALEFPAKYAEASTGTSSEKLEKLSALLPWCIEKNLSLQKEYVAFVILSLDPSYEKARTVSGLARPAPPK
jgi:hypothetical protein